MKKENNYLELVLRLARTDFKLRYQGSLLGYVWAILKPLLLFTILNFVFSTVFNARNNGVPFYSIQLLTGLLIFNFFSEGTMAGLSALVSKAQLVTKIYVPRWILVVASTLNALFVFGANLIVLSFFFIIQGKVPSIEGVLIFFLFIVLLYIVIVSFSFLAAPLYVRFRDLSMIWEVLLSVLMYASPIIYPLTFLPVKFQRALLVSPIAFIVHFSKEGLIMNHFPTFGQMVLFTFAVLGLAGICWFVFSKTEKTVAEHI